MRLSKCLLAGLIGSTALAAAAFAGVGVGSSQFPPVAISDFGPRQDSMQAVQDASGPIETPCRVWWENGAFDLVNALNSQELRDANNNLIFSAVVADDFFMKFGVCYYTEAVEVEFAAFGIPNGIPNVNLRFFDDCNGKPAGQIFTEFKDPQFTNLGQVPGWPGFTKYRLRWNVNLFEYGFRRIWITPVGQGQGLYYWMTSNSGTIQGVQGQYKAPQNGFPDWTNTKDVVPNFGICTDFAFRLCGKCCWELKDNSQFDLAGLSSIAFANGIIFGNRAVDNFQVPPGNPWEICRIEAWMATNCDTKRAFMEIYDNLCDSPTGNPIKLINPDVELLPGVFFDGIQVYRFSFTCPGTILSPGRNYWLSMAEIGVGTPHERAIWLFRRKSACHICITQGQYKSLFLGFPEFTPVSHPGLAGEPRDFAFRIFVTEPVAATPPGTPAEPPVAPTPVSSGSTKIRTLPTDSQLGASSIE